MRVTAGLRLAVVLVVVVGAYASGVLTVFNQRYSLGFSAGYRKGLDEGYEKGYASGYDQGNSTGHSLGYNEGYSEGYEQGLDEGYLKGVVDGAGRGYTVRDPTYREAIAFISLDQTDRNEYIEEKYICQNFAADVKNNAFQKGYRCGYVSVWFPDSGHAIVCFNTTDRGLIFIEPQSDEIMMLTIGKPYWDRSKYLKPSYNDTVISYIIVW